MLFSFFRQRKSIAFAQIAPIYFVKIDEQKTLANIAPI